MSPQQDKVSVLLDWYVNERTLISAKTISMVATDGVDVFAWNESILPNGPYLNLKALTTSVKTGNALYQSCSSDGCSRKVVPVGADQFQWVKCDKIVNTFKWAYMVQAELTDSVGFLWVTIFSNVATKVFGIDGENLGKMKDMDGGTRVRYSVFGCDAVPHEQYIAILKNSLKDLVQLKC